MKTAISLRQCLAAWGVCLALSSVAWSQVERPAANATATAAPGAAQGMATGMGTGGGRNQTVTPPDAAVAADPRNFNGMWQQDDSALGGGMGAGGAPAGGPGGQQPGGQPPGGVAAQGMGAAPNAGAGGAAGGATGGSGKGKLLCIPQAGSIYAGGVGGVQFIQMPTQINIVAEENHRVRRIYLNGEHPKNFEPSYMGHSVGHWEGNTLVVDTTGVKGAAASTHAIERITKNADGTSLEIRNATVDANGRSTEGRTMTLNWLAGRDIAEWICEDYSDEFFSDDYK